MWTLAISILCLSKTVLGGYIFHCPEETSCYEQGAITSTSFQFLDKLNPKQYQTITKLTVENASLSKLPAELKYMLNLEYLDLSNNNIQLRSMPALPRLKTLKLNRNSLKDVQFSWFSKNIEDLDLSSNLISHLPKDWSFLKKLAILHLHKNPIDCDCYNNNVFIYSNLIKRGVHIPEPVICYSPKHLAGKHINSINCGSEDEMINDQPEEGSGETDETNTALEAVDAPYLHEPEEAEENEVIDDKDEISQHFIPVGDASSTITPEEGSGDLEGSGFVEFGHISACVFNCATPEPVGSHDTNNDTAVAPGPKDQIQIIAEDVFKPIFEESKPSSAAPTTSSEAVTTSSPIPPSTEEIVRKVSEQVVYEQPKNTNEAIIFSNETRTGEMEKATAINQNNYAVYVVVVFGLLLAVIFLVCLLKKRNAKRLNKNRRELPTTYGEELKPLEKPSIQPINERNGTSQKHAPEHVPLINGQNGKSQDDPVLKSYTPLEHPESTTDIDEPVIRLKPELLTPITERVTIRASEIPESIPKTPVLVHRQKNSEGEIVTTVLPP